MKSTDRLLRLKNILLAGEDVKSSERGFSPIPIDQVKAIKETNSRWMSNPAFVGLGSGKKLLPSKNQSPTSTKVFRIYVSSLTEMKDYPDAEIPEVIHTGNDVLGSIEVEIIEIGKPKFRSPPCPDPLIPYKTLYRPIQPGCSVGVIGPRFLDLDKLQGGTLTCIVEKKSGESGELFALGNAHVISYWNLLEIGKPVYQPGCYNLEEGTIANLTLGYPVDAGGVNSIDAAIAMLVDNEIASNNVLGLGDISGIETDIHEDMLVKLSGAVSGVREGTIIDTDAAIWFDWVVPGGNVSTSFDNQILVLPADANTTMSSFGDSGAPVVTSDNKLVGLLMGEREADEKIKFPSAVCNNICNVFEGLEIKLAQV